MIHLSFIINPVCSKSVEGRDTVGGQDRLEDPRNRICRYRSFLQSQRSVSIKIALRTARIGIEATDQRFASVSTFGNG